jgi:uncharacterized coiled-coil DUF342 family protein
LKAEKEAAEERVQSLKAANSELSAQITQLTEKATKYKTKLKETAKSNSVIQTLTEKSSKCETK